LQDNVTKASGDMILLDAKGGVGDIPTIAGYDNLAGFTDTPLLVDTTQPNWSLTQEGIFYDGMVKHIYSRQEIASFSAGYTVAVPDSNSWKEEIVLSGRGENISSGFKRKIAAKYVHDKAFKEIKVTGYTGSSNISGDQIITSTTLQIRIEVGSVTFTKEISGSIDETFDISTLTDGTQYFAEFYMQISATSDNSGSTRNATVTGQVFEDIEITAQTGKG
jgi:hypothetical protein